MILAMNFSLVEYIFGKLEDDKTEKDYGILRASLWILQVLEETK